MMSTETESLAELQRQFSDWVNGKTQQIPTDSKSAQHLSVKDCAQVYRDSVFLTRLNALILAFPVTQALIGDKCFQQTVNQFLQQVTFKHSTFEEFTAEFPRFLGTCKPLQTLVYLPDVAKLEACYEQIMELPTDTSPVDTHDIDRHNIDKHNSDTNNAALSNALKTTHIHIQRPATSALLQSDYPILKIWQLHQPGYSQEQTVDLDEGGEQLIIWRVQQQSPVIERLSQDEWQLLALLEQPHDINTLCEKLLAKNEHCQPQQLIPSCLAKGWISLLPSV